MAAIGRFQKGDEIFYAKVVDGELFRLRGDVFGSPSFDRKPTPRKGVKTLVPVVPSKIICRRPELRRPRARDGQGAAEGAVDSGSRPPRRCCPTAGRLRFPFREHRTDFEAELAIVIGRKIRNVSPTQASRYIFGYTAAQDISDRTIQKAESQWARAKSFDTFTPLGPLRGDED